MTINKLITSLFLLILVCNNCSNNSVSPTKNYSVSGYVYYQGFYFETPVFRFWSVQNSFYVIWYHLIDGLC